MPDAGFKRLPSIHWQGTYKQGDVMQFNQIYFPDGT